MTRFALFLLGLVVAAGEGKAAAPLSLGNRALEASWSADGGHLALAHWKDGLAGRDLPAPAELFTLVLDSGRRIRASDLALVGTPEQSGDALSATLASADGTLRVRWRAVLGAQWLRQIVTLEALQRDVPLSRIELLDWTLPGAHPAGTARGVPVVADDLYCGFEHPMSENTVRDGRAVCALERRVPLSPNSPFTCSAVVGVTHPGQLRREFLEYVEATRAHPYRPFLHYNSWYDLRAHANFTTATAVAAIRAIGDELVAKRGAKVDSYLFDDGWDDTRTIWKFNDQFPQGFTPLREAAAAYGGAPGVWLSPWGGYAQARQQRLAMARKAGLEINAQGLALSGPKYFEFFRNACLDFERKYGVNQFKFDGTGNATGRYPGSRFGSNFEAAIQLIDDLRVAKPDVYINLTTGTWPSPFWLKYADSIWRGGDDHSFSGEGSYRQQWITYRDTQTYRRIVQPSPLYPLNSLMLHGIIYARYAQNLMTDPKHEFASEVREFFGTGTDCQELYVTPETLSKADWDVLAEAAKWSRENAATLRDTHWVGGDPGKDEVYGWAAWSPSNAILTLRNPSSKPATITIDPAKAFELPPNAATDLSLHSPWSDERSLPAIDLHAGTATEIPLAPFQVRTLVVR